jgi:hypothetical protein
MSDPPQNKKCGKFKTFVVPSEQHVGITIFPQVVDEFREKLFLQFPDLVESRYKPIIPYANIVTTHNYIQSNCTNFLNPPDRITLTNLPRQNLRELTEFLLVNGILPKNDCFFSPTMRLYHCHPVCCQPDKTVEFDLWTFMPLTENELQSLLQPGASVQSVNDPFLSNQYQPDGSPEFYSTKLYVLDRDQKTMAQTLHQHGFEFSEAITSINPFL